MIKFQYFIKFDSNVFLPQATHQAPFPSMTAIICYNRISRLHFSRNGDAFSLKPKGSIHCVVLITVKVSSTVRLCSRSFLRLF